MKKIYKYLFSFIVFTSFFIFNVKADYEATVVNPSGANCYLNSKSTGYCFYQNSNLNTVGGSVHWLDTGDEVKVLTEYESIPTNDQSLCSDYYVYTSYYYAAKSNTYYGYYCNANLSIGALTDELKQEFSDAGFPESYWNKLAILKKTHPNWNFIAINTKLDFNAAVDGESVSDRSLIETSASNNYAYFSIDSYSFDYYNDKFIEYDRIGSTNPFCRANKDAIAYYMDPRNFLNDMYIFQFEGLAYDSNISDEKFIDTINSLFKDDYMVKFSLDFLTAGKESKVSPVYLAALSKQEVSNGDTPGTAIDGLYNNMYNFYNIGATGDQNPVYNGLDFASKEDISTLRPWDTEYKAIVGGALWMADKYISVGQDTSYFKRWNVIYNYLKETGKISDPYQNFQHQYMTNVMAPSSEAHTTYKSYYDTKMLDLGFIFYIPVYENMPDKTYLPVKIGWPNNYLKNIYINGNNIAGFDGAVEVYNYNLDINEPKISIDAVPVSNNAKITGLGEFEITEDITKEIIVTAENGDIKTYKLNITLTGTKLEEPIDVLTTLNNAGIKNGDKYLSGFEPGTDINFIKDRVLGANKEAILEFKDSTGNEKTNGNLMTGDQVSITVSNETKSYEIVIYGDANGDGEINAIDYVRIRKYIMNTASLNGSNNEAADVNKDGEVNAIDYVRIRKYIMSTATIEQ